MHPALKVMVAVTGGLLLLLGGLVLGYLAGYGDNAASAASAGSGVTASALRALRDGKTEEAIKWLEASLDGELITSWAFRNTLRPRVAISREDERKFLLRAAEYRRKYPSQLNNAELKAWIDEIASGSGRE